MSAFDSPSRHRGRWEQSSFAAPGSACWMCTACVVVCATVTGALVALQAILLPSANSMHSLVHRVPFVNIRGHLTGGNETNWPYVAPPETPAMQRMFVKKVLDESEMPGIDSGPWMPGWKNKVAICTVMKEENATDVREWLLYHRWLGVKKVFIYEHFTNEPLADHPALTDLVESGFMNYQQTDTHDNQGHLFHRCLVKHRKEFSWIAFIDADEYIVLRKTGKGKLPEFLDDYKFHGGLTMNWMMMGWNNREYRPQYGGVMRHYTKCNPTPSKIIKTIVNTFFTVGGHQVHNFWHRGFMPSVNEHGFAVPPMCKQKTNETAWEEDPACQFKASRSIEQPEQITVDRIALFHFFSKSKEDYMIKMRKGLAAGNNKRTMVHFKKMSVRKQTKIPMCKELSKVADKCCPEWKG